MDFGFAENSDNKGPSEKMRSSSLSREANNTPYLSLREGQHSQNEVRKKLEKHKERLLSRLADSVRDPTFLVYAAVLKLFSILILVSSTDCCQFSDLSKMDRHNASTDSVFQIR
jgi:hypothetical protein